MADVFATAALLAASRELGAKHALSPANMLLYFDEPNMGLHLSTATAAAAASLMRDAPLTAVLASATLAGWGALPSWWRGDGSPACRSVITTEPYDLPHAQLSLYTPKAGTRVPISLLSLFPSHAAFAAAVRGGPARRRILMLRHLTPAQANSLLLHGMPQPQAPAEGGAAAAPDGGLHALSGSVRTAREQLELALLRLADDPARYEALRRAWAMEASRGKQQSENLRAACSTSGVTLIATLNPRRVALELSGWGPEGTPESERWAAEVHALKGKMAGAAKSAKAAEKEAARQKNDEARPADDGGAAPGYVTLRSGLSVLAEDAAAADDDSLVMLSKGVAYACGARDAQPPALAKRLYQQALLSVPERATLKRLPPIHILVVDYSSVYGELSTLAPAAHSFCRPLRAHARAAMRWPWEVACARRAALREAVDSARSLL